MLGDARNRKKLVSFTNTNTNTHAQIYVLSSEGITDMRIGAPIVWWIVDCRILHRDWLAGRKDHDKNDFVQNIMNI